MARAKKTTTKKAEPKVEMYKVTINDDDFGGGSNYADPVYFTKATSREEALTKVLPAFFKEHAGEDIENLQVDRDTETTFIE